MGQQHQVGRVATTVANIGEQVSELRLAGGQKLEIARGAMAVTYHSTQVVIWDENAIILNSGGWRTSTTKTRMNQAASQYGLGFKVYQENFEWYVRILKDGKWDGGITVDFYDGMILSRAEMQRIAEQA